MSRSVVRRAPRALAVLVAALAFAGCRDATAADPVSAALTFPVPATQAERLAWPVTPSIELVGDHRERLVVRATARFGCGIPEAVATRIGTQVEVTARVRPGTEENPCALVVLEQPVRVEVSGLPASHYTVSARVAGHDGLARFDLVVGQPD